MNDFKLIHTKQMTDLCYFWKESSDDTKQQKKRAVYFDV